MKNRSKMMDAMPRTLFSKKSTKREKYSICNSIAAVFIFTTTFFAFFVLKLSSSTYLSRFQTSDVWATSIEIYDEPTRASHLNTSQCKYRGNFEGSSTPIDVTILLSKIEKRWEEVVVMLNSLLFFRTCPVRFHIISDEAEKQLLSEFIRSIHPDLNSATGVSFRFYDLGMYLDSAEGKVRDRIPKKVNERFPASLVKASLEKVLLDVETTVVLDADLLVLDDICKLREYITEMTSKEALFAMTWDAQPPFRSPDQRLNVCIMENITEIGPGTSDTKYMCNAGFSIVNLAKMREVKWSEQWNREVISANVPMTNVDQTVFNFMGYHHPEFFHPLPVSWNVQTHWGIHSLMLLDDLLTSGNLHVAHGTGQYFMLGGGCVLSYFWHSFREWNNIPKNYYKSEYPQDLVGRECEVRNALAELTEAKILPPIIQQRISYCKSKNETNHYFK